MIEKVFNSNIPYVRGVNPMNMPVRTLLWTLLLAFFGFLFVGRGVPVVSSATIGGAFVGASSEGRIAKEPELVPISGKDRP
jgi:hypothetical protein